MSTTFGRKMEEKLL